MKRHNTRCTLREMKKKQVYYWFFLPFGIVFLLFYIVPVVISIILSLYLLQRV
jgi:ABC-type sugar transport system permease subunit